KPFSNQRAQEVFDLLLFYERGLCNPFVHILWQPQRHLHSLTHTAHQAIPSHPQLDALSIPYTDNPLCLSINFAGFCHSVNSPFRWPWIVREPNAAPQPRLEAAAQRRLEGVGCRRWLGAARGQRLALVPTSCPGALRPCPQPPPP